jgi:hypothetical protein
MKGVESPFDARSFVGRVDEARALLEDLFQEISVCNPKRVWSAVESLCEAKVQLAMVADEVERIFDV